MSALPIARDLHLTAMHWHNSSLLMHYFVSAKLKSCPSCQHRCMFFYTSMIVSNLSGCQVYLSHEICTWQLCSDIDSSLLKHYFVSAKLKSCHSCQQLFRMSALSIARDLHLTAYSVTSMSPLFIHSFVWANLKSHPCCQQLVNYLLIFARDSYVLTSIPFYSSTTLYQQKQNLVWLSH